MAKQSGLGDSLLVAGYNLSGDIGAVQRIAAPSDVFDVTAIDKSAYERILGKLDGVIEFNAFFNDATDQEHLVLRAKGSGADRVCSYLHGSAIGNWGAGLVAKQLNYDPMRAADGSLTIGVQMLGSLYGLDHGVQLTAGLRTDTAATNGAAVDGGAATSRGLSAYLQVTAVTGTSVTVKIQDSADGTTDWQDVTGAAFAAVLGGAVSGQRIVTSLTLAVRRHLRVVSSGTFNPATFSVIACRFPVA